jgi:hypothetical protein
MKVRPPAVAGSFYDARADRLTRDVRAHLAPDAVAAPAFGAIVPHAGYVYSGPVAGAVYARLRMPAAVIILCPNHTGRGAPAALDPSDLWRTPLGDVPVNRRLAARLLALAPSLVEDAEAHRREHSLEVQLPFLQIVRPGLSLVPVSIGEPSLTLCREIGEALARLAAEEEEAPLLLASSDMNHYESRDIGHRKDDRALAQIAALDPEGLFRTVRAEAISMCGFLPATALLFAARGAGVAAARVVARRDSGDETRDTASVVGYAGVILDPPPATPS